MRTLFFGTRTIFFANSSNFRKGELSPSSFFGVFGVRACFAKSAHGEPLCDGIETHLAHGCGSQTVLKDGGNDRGRVQMQ